MAQSGPPPSKLCALSELGTRAVGEKVRFLGCITNYNTTTAILTLHSHPSHPSPSPSTSASTSTTTTRTPPSTSHHAALIDLTLLLSSTPLPPTNIGEWVNVIGYITAQQSAPSPRPPSESKKGDNGRRGGAGKGEHSQSHTTSTSTSTSIQALLLWSAGSVNVQEYEQVLSSLKAES
ncbi:hypothetical protein V490_06043 [Pseudogymnoascus sp. VKM F-3557]|nr:hypothetical protein V490_06043 [Pseudogymnoascus sp. VKM F-3557]